MPTAILFDLDGTLVDSEAVNGEAAIVAVRALGGVLDDAAAQALRTHVIGRTWEDAARFVIASGLFGGGGPDAAQLEQAMLDAKLTHFEETAFRALPFAAQAVRQAAVRGPVAIVSGSRRIEIEHAVRRLDLGDLIGGHNLIGAEDYPRGKPAPDPYLEGARRVGLPPASCIAIEDSRAGIASAHAAGLRVVAVRAGNFASQDQSAADVIIETLEALDATVEHLTR